MPADLAGEAHAARAHDAAVVVEEDVVADVLLGLLGLVFLEAALAAAVLVGVILQVALAGLVAHRAIQRVVDQQVLHHLLLVGDGLGRSWSGRPCHRAPASGRTARAWGCPSTSTRQIRHEATIDSPG